MLTALPRFALVAVLALSACTLRPRYAQLLEAAGPTDSETLVIQVVDTGSGQPLGGVPVEVKVGRERLATRTDEQGRFSMPVRKDWVKDNPIIVVSPPPQTRGYDLVVVGGGAAGTPEAPPAQPEPVAEQPAPAASPFDGCEITAPKGASRLLKCETIVAAVTVTGADANPDEVLDATVAGMKASLQAELKVERGEVDLAGGKRKMVALEATRPGEGERRVASGVVVAVPQGETLRTVSCIIVKPFEGAEQKCGALITALAEQSPDPTEGEAPAAAGADDLSFAGQTLKVPEGCTHLPGRIDCGPVSFAWHSEEAAPSETPAIEELSVPLRAAFTQLGTLKEEDRACTVAGLEGACRAFSIATRDGKSLYALYGIADSQGQRLFVECDGDGAPPKAAPPPCDQVLTLK